MYKCKECEFKTPIEAIRCKACNKENSFEYIREEKVVTNRDLPSRYKKGSKGGQAFKRYSFKDDALNELFGGWLVNGSVNFVSAEPGAGKSTFLGQIGLLLQEDLNIVYFSGEENEAQVMSRMERLYQGKPLDKVAIYYGDEVEDLVGILHRDKPDIVIVDSINSISGESYTRQAENMRLVTKTLKTLQITGFVIGHINKSGEIAGKKTLEHEVDGVFLISGQESRTDSVRTLKALKLRFGPTDSVVVMRMEEHGFDIVDPTEAFKIFIEESPNSAGSVFAPVLEGNQLFLLEVQSLITESSYANPTNVAKGIPKQNLSILLAMLTKVTRMEAFRERDVFVSFIGPEELKHTNVDLAVVMSLVSAQLNKNIKKYIFLGSVGLTGEIRSAPRQGEIVKRLIKHGYRDENIITREKYKNIKDLIVAINSSK